MSILEARFKVNNEYHQGVEWPKVEARLKEASSEKLWSLNEMERIGGEPDVVGAVKAMGVGGVLNEDQVIKLQQLVELDEPTWFWIDTPEEIREKYVALIANWSFCGVPVPEYHSDVDLGFYCWLRV